MYYNNKFRVANIIISIVAILIAVFGIVKSNLKIVMPIMLILLGLQQLVMGVNSLKLNKRKEYTLSIGVSIFIFVCSIVSIKFMIS